MTPSPTVWPALRYDDAPAAIRFLVDVLGFEETLVVPGSERAIAHAELRWPPGGGVMLGSTGGPADPVHDTMKPGAGAIYIVADDATAVDAIHSRVATSPATITAALHDTDYDSHGFSLRDPEGNSWTIGTYRGA